MKEEDAEPKKDPKVPATVKLFFADEKNHGTSVMHLIYQERITLPRGIMVEVSAADAKGIKEAFGGRYEIEEV